LSDISISPVDDRHLLLEGLLMQPVVAKLSSDDMIALAAFMASRTP
jgi:cytochrome c553